MVKEEQRNFISLQAKTRRQDIQRISQENLEFSKRLIERKPNIDRKKWDSDYNLSKYYMGNICEFPPTINFAKKISGYEGQDITTPTQTNLRISNGFRDSLNQFNSGFTRTLTRYNKTTKDKFLVFNKLIESKLTFI